MNGKERIRKILHHQPVDRIGIYEDFWGETTARWTQEGHLQPGEEVRDHFHLDMARCDPFNVMIDPDFERKILSENEDSKLELDGNGATLRWSKLGSGAPEHVAFAVNSREKWEEVKHKLTPDPKRIRFEEYRAAKAKAEKLGQFFVLCGTSVFELMHPVCGHEALLMAMGLDPEWVEDMVYTYSHFIVEMQKMLFEQEGYPDGIWYYEDMGYKGSPFMSPDMYREMIMPGHKHMINYAKSVGLPVIMHSCGFIEPLLPHMIEAGIDALQAMEVKAGMDMLKIYELYGDKIALIGGIDTRVLYSNDKQKIDEELQKKIPVVKNGFGYILHSDHSIPPTVDYESYRYFVEKGLELGRYD